MPRAEDALVPPPRRGWQRVAAGVLVALWGLPVLGIAIGKWALEGSSGFWQHLTNWNFLLQGVFFSSALAAFWSRQATFWVHTFLFYTAWGVGWCVFWLAFVMVGDSPEEVLKLMSLYGGEYDSGFVLVMDRLLHVVPAVMLLFYVAARRHELGYFVSFYFRQAHPRPAWQLFVFYTGLLFGQPALFVAPYVLAFDFRDVYSLNVPSGAVFAIGLGILLVFQLGITWYHHQYTFQSYYARAHLAMDYTDADLDDDPAPPDYCRPCCPWPPHKRRRPRHHHRAEPR